MRSRISISAFFLVTIMVGQPTFNSPAEIYQEGTLNYSFPADIDSDGDIDILGVKYEENKIYWLKNDGSQNYTKNEITTTVELHSLLVIDLDNDGDMDIISTSLSDKIEWYENNGSENFSANTITTSLQDPHSIFAIDVDNDGDIDIISKSAGDNKIAWLENNGSQSFTTHTISTSSSYYTVHHAIFAIDVDKDGDIDIVSTSANNEIAWHENNGSQSFTKRVIISPKLGNPVSVYAKDIDLDGDIDLLSASLEGSNKIAWFENNGSQSFSTSHSISTINKEAYDVQAFDIDLDGDIDIIGNVQYGIEIYENNGSESFTIHQLSHNSGGNSFAFNVKDVDSDGDPDLISSRMGKIVLYDNTMEKGQIADFVETNIYSSLQIDSGNESFAVDMDNDGDIDIITAGGTDQTLAWHENNGSESFTARTLSTSAFSPHSVYGIDIDEDGDMDVLASYGNYNYDTSSDIDKVVWFENNGSQSFTERTISNNNNGTPKKILAADMDNDGDIDVIVASFSGEEVLVYQNNGSENFSQVSLGRSPDCDNCESIAIVDLDQDGDNDIVFASPEDGVGWYLNNGNSNFSGSWFSKGSLVAFSIDFADIDGDGDIDLLASGTGPHGSGIGNNYDSRDNKIIWYENDGSESFTAHTVSTKSNSATDKKYYTSSHALDMDKDGDIDIISGNYDKTISFFENNGSEVFTEKSFGGSHSIKHIFPVDLDQDGNIDIVSSNYSGSSSNYKTFTWMKQSYDAIVPTVSSITSSVSDGIYKIGDVIPITINWSEAAVVTGSPKLKLETGSTDQYATYSSGSGSTSLIFNYTIVANDTTPDLDYHSTSALELNGGTIKDASGNTAVLTLPAPGGSGSLGANKTIVIDGNVPTVSSVTSTKVNGGYIDGTTIPITITFSQSVNVTGTPQLTLETGATDAVVDYTSGSGTASLIFNYVVTTGQNSSNLDYISTSSLSLNSGTIKDASGNNAVLTLPTPGASGSLSANKNLVIDTTSPTISSVSSVKASAAYKVGESIPITITFDDKVTVAGVPQVILETGSSDAVASYTSGTGSNDLIFNYTVGASDQSSDLSYTSTSALSLNSGTIQDSLGNNAILTLPAPGSANSLSSNEAIIIDNQSPVVSLDPADGASSVLPSLPLKINFDEYVRFIDNTILTSDNVDALITLKDSNAQGTDIPFDAIVNDAKTVITIDPNTDFLSEQIIYYSISSSLEDSLDHLAQSASATVNIKDVIKPTVTFNPSNGSIKIPGNRDITISFNEKMRKIDDSEITNANVSSLVKLKGNNASGADFNFSATINDAKTVITIDPLFDFSANSVVYVGIDAVVEDDADNAIEAASAIFITDIPDVIGPQVVNVTSTNEDKTYTTGDNITVTIEFDEVAVVEGSGSLQLELLTKDPSVPTFHSAADYLKGSGTTMLELTYTIGSNENSTDLSYRSNTALEIIGASLTVKDRIGNNANLSLPNPGSQGSLSFNKNIVIDTKEPLVVSVGSSTENGSYRNGAIIKIVVDFDENVNVMGSPSVILETGSNKGSAIYSSGSATSTLVFDYTVQTEHNTNDLDYAGNNALKLNGGSIKDIVAIDANLLLPIVNSNTLGGRKDIRIDNIPPQITQSSIVDNGNIPVLNNSKVIYTVSEKLQSADLNMASSLGDIVNGKLTVINDNQSSSVDLDLLAPFTSGDMIKVTIQNLTDLAGNVSQDIEFEYNVSLIADYNTDGFIDAADLTTLVQGWTNKDLVYELGPTTGEVPNLKPALDGKFDIMDAAVLIRMWHWNLNNNSQAIPRYATMGNPIQYQNKDNSFSIDILENINAMDLYIDYPIDKVQISILDQPSKNNNILLTHLDSLSGIFQLAAGFMDDVDKGLDFNYQIHGREDVTINVVYRYFDNNGNVLSKGTEEILLKAVPQEFALHNNYPNPFNPTTTMRFDLPIQTDAKVIIFNMLGQKVKTFDLKGVSAGYHSVKWNARNDLGDPVGAGVYFYQLQTKDFVKTRKMVLLK